MATITTDTYLDGGTARTAGETWIINGATLTIRTDTRWHANAPASMTGSLGRPTTSYTLGGKVLIDATAVRWMAFDTGTGNVPAIGTSITQGGVSGYLLGVWASVTSAPTAVGAAMPASGFLKFREVTGGQYSAGALTGIGANASSVDVQGWIEVVFDQGTQLHPATCSSLTSFVMRGGWFDLGVTSGSAGQSIQLPTNGGGSGTSVQAIQIETAPDSGVYEWYNAVHSSNFLTTSLGTDARSKFVCYTSGGVVLIGNNGTTNVGFVPAAGCKIRVPSIFGRQCTTAARASNVAPNTTLSSRASFAGNNGFILDIENASVDWYISGTTNCGMYRIVNTAYESQVNLTFNGDGYLIDSSANGNSTTYSGNGISFTNANAPGLINNCKIYGYYNSPLNFSGCSNVTLTNSQAYCIASSRASAQVTIFGGVRNLVVDNCKFLGGNILSAGNGQTFTNIDYVDRIEGATTSSAGQYAVTFSNTAVNVTIDNLSFGFGGTIANCHPYNSVFCGQGCANIQITNCGTFDTKLSAGSTSSAYPAYVWQSLSPDTNIKLKRVYLSNTRTTVAAVTNTCTNFLFEHVYGISATAFNMLAGNIQIKSFGGTLPTGLIETPGYSFHDGFNTATAGWLIFKGVKPSAAGAPYVTLSVADAKSGFDNTGRVRLKNVGDYVIFESHYAFKGHTAFTSATAGGVNALTNHSLQYQIDTGSGYGGTWKTANTTNLQAETVNPAGTKMMFKITCTTAAATNEIQYASVVTVTTSAAQSANLFPISTSTLSFTGLPTGAEVRCFVGTDPATAVEIGGTESTSGSTFSFSHSSGGQAGYIGIISLGYETQYFDYTYKSSDDSILIQPIVDRNYSNPA